MSTPLQNISWHFYARMKPAYLLGGVFIVLLGNMLGCSLLMNKYL